MKIAYTYVGVDIFHYGHLRLLEHARRIADRHVCGLLTDDVCRAWNGSLVMVYEERLAVLKALRCIDEVVRQDGLDPTPNLRALHEQFPDAELILFQSHQSWSRMPGSQFVTAIGGRVVRPEFYPRLSRRLIAEELTHARAGPSVDMDGFLLGNVSVFGPGKTKAATLQALRPTLQKSRIERIFCLTVGDWKTQRQAAVRAIRDEFAETIVVRSSALVEDSRAASFAGVFCSVLNVSPADPTAVERAVDQVVASYEKVGQTDPDDQVLIQPQTTGVRLSGVLFTRIPVTGAPYYLINFAVGSATDTVTSGAAAEKIEIPRDLPPDSLPDPWRQVIGAAREVEGLLEDLVLDIEFAVTHDGEVVIFQVRPCSTVSRFDHVPDGPIADCRRRLRAQLDAFAASRPSGLLLSDMSFWNPAEIIGDRASNLAYSLYRRLILRRAWNEGLRPLGYRAVDDELMIRVGNKPYIVVENAFAALLPAALPAGTAEKLLRCFSAKLAANPALHDKIEFDIVPNAFLPMTDRRLTEMAAALTPAELTTFRDALIALTQQVFDGYEAVATADRASLKALAERRAAHLAAAAPAFRDRLNLCLQLLNDARELGVIPFVRMARMAFIGNAFLKDLVSAGALAQADVDAFAGSIKTVASELSRAMDQAIRGALPWDLFAARFGHLRPGTYDIVQLPYSKNPAYLGRNADLPAADEPACPPFDRPALAARLDRFLATFPVKISAERLLAFVEEATRGREFFKFEFTKNLSLALEILAEIGGSMGLSRTDLAHLSMESVEAAAGFNRADDAWDLWHAQIVGRKTMEDIFRYVALPSFLTRPDALDRVESGTARPNFVTSSVVRGEIVNVEALAPEDYDRVAGRIVLIEKADPGYDWIFSKHVAGLITRFGGVASHMAIRCAEFGIPAAIGCGETLFQAMRNSRTVMIDAREKRLASLS